MSEDYNKLKAQKEAIEQKQLDDLIRDAVLAEREKCIKEACLSCRKGRPVCYDRSYHTPYRHRFDLQDSPCSASLTRERAAREGGE